MRYTTVLPAVTYSVLRSGPPKARVPPSGYTTVKIRLPMRSLRNIEYLRGKRDCCVERVSLLYETVSLHRDAWFSIMLKKIPWT